MKKLIIMKKFVIKSLIFGVITAVTTGLSAQTPGTLWQKVYGGDDDDEGHSVSQTTDGGYIIAGRTQSFGAGGNDVYLVKTDKDGNVLWSNTYGGEENDGAWSVRQTLDGGYIVTGYTASFGAGDLDVYLIKTDASGNLKWEKTFGGVSDDEGASVVETTDSCYVVTGYTRSNGKSWPDVYLLKTDPGGNLLWSKTFGGEQSDAGNCIKTTYNGGFIVSGYTTSGAGWKDIYLIRTDGNGDTSWTKTIGNEYDDEGFSVQQTTDTGFIVTGYTWSNDHNSEDVYLVKTDAAGNVLWTKTYGNNNEEEGKSVIQTLDGGYVLTGFSKPGTFYDAYVVRTDENGDTLWTKILGGVSNDLGFDIVQTGMNDYIVAGWSDSFFPPDHRNVYLVRLGLTNGVNQTASNQPERLRISPNPFREQTTVRYYLNETGHVTLSVFNSSGQKIETLVSKRQTEGFHNIRFNAAGLPRGSYLIKLELNGAVTTAKALLLN